MVDGRNWKNRIDTAISQAISNLEALRQHSDAVATAAQLIVTSLRSGGKIMFCGNGGSAADAQHLAAEFMGRYLKDRAPLSALALTVDSSALTAIANDYSYADVFARQLIGIGRKGDVLIGISTSGTSENVVRALTSANNLDIRTILFTGNRPLVNPLIADLVIAVPSLRTNEIQEMHILVGHIICGIVEDKLC